MSQAPELSVRKVTLVPVVYQGADYPIHIRFKTSGQLAADDRFLMDFRETFGGAELGSIGAATGELVIDISIPRATLWLRRNVTDKWFGQAVKDGEVSEANRLRDISGTIVHTDKDGYTKGMSGKVELGLKFYIGLTRD